MKLYDFALSPSPRRVRMFLAEKDITVETVQVQLRDGENHGEAYRKINPNRFVPALELDDGTVICEAPAICRYFEALHPDPPLMGREPKEQAEIAMWERWADINGFMAVADALRNSAERFKDRALVGKVDYAQIPELAERGRARAEHFLTELDARLGESEWVAGPSFSVADITAYVTIVFGEMIELEVPGNLKNLNRWHELMSARPSVEA